MLGFAIVDNQPAANATAVWLTCHLDGSQVSHTNAVVIMHDDERHDAKVRALTRDRAVVLTNGTKPPIPFDHALNVEAFDGLIDETSAHQRLIADAVAAYAARTKSPNLVMPEFSSAPNFTIDDRDEPAYRALSVANYVAQVWSAWLATEMQRVRRTTDPRTGKTPWIMPDALGSPLLADFPPKFGHLVQTRAVALMLNYTAIDFETANSYRGSPCAVGLVRVRDGVACGGTMLVDATARGGRSLRRL